MATTTPSGWYPDPSGVPGQMRYWSGAGWTQHTAQSQGAPPAPPRRKRRIFTWVIVGVNVVFLLWIIAAVASSHPSNCGTLTQQDCATLYHAGEAIGVGLVVAFWAFVDVILGVIWLVTRKRDPQIVVVQPPPPLP